MKVVGHEQRAGGVFVEFKGTRYTASPFSLLDITANGNAKPDATPTKGDKAKATAKAKKSAPKKSAPKKTVAPTPANATADPAKAKAA